MISSNITLETETLLKELNQGKNWYMAHESRDMIARAQAAALNDLKTLKGAFDLNSIEIVFDEREEKVDVKLLVSLKAGEDPRSIDDLDESELSYEEDALERFKSAMTELSGFFSHETRLRG